MKDCFSTGCGDRAADKRFPIGGIPGEISQAGGGRLLTKRNLAEYLGVSVRTVESYQRQGLPYFRLGPRRNRYDLLAVREWLERRCRVVRLG